MTRFRYSLLVALPALIVCWPIGKTAKRIEVAARRVRLMCASKMQRVIDNVPQEAK